MTDTRDFERIDKLEKDFSLLTDLYGKVIHRQEMILEDCAETFAIIASEIQVVRTQLLEVREILEPKKDTKHDNTKSPQ